MRQTANSSAGDEPASGGDAALVELPDADVAYNGGSSIASIDIFFMWQGDSLFLLENLILKDFRVRYRNMSLGILWSLLNPLVMMGVMTFVFSTFFRNPNIHHFPVFVLCGLVPFNFFSIAWISGTTSVVDNSAMVKRVPVPREIVPVAAVLSTCLHLGIQILLLISATLIFGLGANIQWLWLPLLWFFEVVFVCGLAFLTSAINVYIRDMRYVVESMNTILFWLVPICYPFAMIPEKYRPIYEVNPIASLVNALRYVLLEAKAPPPSTLWRLPAVSFFMLALGLFVFRRMKGAFYEHI
jgi:homopolymeric O-antigen transport system permease protein